MSLKSRLLTIGAFVGLTLSGVSFANQFVNRAYAGESHYHFDKDSNFCVIECTTAGLDENLDFDLRGYVTTAEEVNVHLELTNVIIDLPNLTEPAINFHFEENNIAPYNINITFYGQNNIINTNGANVFYSNDYSNTFLNIELGDPNTMVELRCAENGTVLPMELKDHISFTNCMSISGQLPSTNKMISEMTTLSFINLMYTEAEECTHDYIVDEDGSIAGSCLQKEKTCYKCLLCGDAYYEEGEYGPHDFISETVVSNPTCTEGGLSRKYCGNCKQTIEYTLEPRGHQYPEMPDEILEPTCTVDGYIRFICIVCQNLEEEILEAEGHQYGNPLYTAPTCTTDGSYVSVCDVCGDVKTEVVPSKGHAYGQELISEATCQQGERHYKVCQTCQDVLVISEGEPLDHEFEIFDAKLPTCLEDGFNTYICGQCKTSKTEVVNALGHLYSEPVITSATCTLDGQATYTCIRCQDVKTETIEATGHEYGDPIRVEPTCLEDGSITIKCANCDDEIVETIPALGHKYGAPVIVEATCTKDGSSTITCERCNNQVVETIEATGHSFENPVTENPTCLKDGKTTYTCSKCGELKIDTIDRVNHRFEHISEVKATCITKGIKEQWHCLDCDKYSLTDDDMTIDLSDTQYETQLDLNNHSDYETYVVGKINPTIQKEGYEGDIYCSGCKTKIGEGSVIPRLDNDEKSEEEKKQDAVDSIIEVIENAPEEINQEEVSEAIDNVETSTLVVIADAANEATNEINELFEGKDDDEKVEVQPGVELTKEEANEVVSTVIASTILMSANKIGSLEETIHTESTLPNGTYLGLEGVVSNFFDKTLNDMLGKSNSNQVLDTYIGLPIKKAQETSGIDFSLNKETYILAVSYVEVSVDNINSTARKIRNCSGEKMIEHVNTYITGISVSCFRDFDKVKADEEFLKNAYEGILLTLQNQVLTSLEETYENAKKNKSGTALSELNSRYLQEKELVSHLHFIEDINESECEGCFEDVVIEIMRLKYLAVLDNMYSKNQIDLNTYNLEKENASDITSFKPTYLYIFRCWCLQEENTNKVQVTLEELTEMTIDESINKVEPKLEIRKSLTGKETNFFTIFGILGLAIVTSTFIYFGLRKEREVA